MIDEKPIRSEVTVFKRVYHRLGNFSGTFKEMFSNMFTFFKKRKLPRPLDLMEVSDKKPLDQVAKIITKELSFSKNVLVITFDTRTRALAALIKDKEIDIEKRVYWVDAVSYNLGLGAPPVFNLFCINKPTDFENIFYYSVMHIDKMEVDPITCFVVFPHLLLKDIDYNEIGVFFRWYTEKLVSLGIATIFIYRKSADQILNSILSRLVKKR